jgi:hypothetical protein
MRAGDMDHGFNGHNPDSGGLTAAEVPEPRSIQQFAVVVF